MELQLQLPAQTLSSSNSQRVSLGERPCDLWQYSMSPGGRFCISTILLASASLVQTEILFKLAGLLGER